MVNTRYLFRKKQAKQIAFYNPSKCYVWPWHTFLIKNQVDVEMLKQTHIAKESFTFYLIPHKQNPQTASTLILFKLFTLPRESKPLKDQETSWTNIIILASLFVLLLLCSGCYFFLKKFQMYTELKKTLEQLEYENTNLKYKALLN